MSGLLRQGMVTKKLTKNIKQTCCAISFVAQIEIDWTSVSWWENRISWFVRAPHVWSDRHIVCCNVETRAKVSGCAVNCTKENIRKPQTIKRK
jgi:hypothetical protein